MCFHLLLNPGINGYFVFESFCKLLGDKCYLHWAVFNAVANGIFQFYNTLFVHVIGMISPVERKLNGMLCNGLWNKS